MRSRQDCGGDADSDEAGHGARRHPHFRILREPRFGPFSGQYVPHGHAAPLGYVNGAWLSGVSVVGGFRSGVA
jgi:hypothetical protein